LPRFFAVFIDVVSSIYGRILRLALRIFEGLVNPIKMSNKIFGIFFLLTLVSCSNIGNEKNILNVKTFPNRTQDFSLWQLEPFNEEVQMGYILKADDGNIIVVDGGGILTAPTLEAYIEQLGGTVHTWILSHPHLDHIGAFLEILNNKKVKIGGIVHVPLPVAWVEENEAITVELLKQYNSAVAASNAEKMSVEVGDSFELAEGVRMSVLNAFNENITQNAVNNSSLVFTLESASKKILFLGDLGVKGGSDLLARTDSLVLKSNYVQMAHHGQQGVDKAFYKAVEAEYALWPTPKWLWENRADGQGYNTGNFMTFEVRAWMDELGIKTNYVSGLDGTIQID